MNTRLPSFRASYVCYPRVFSHANGFYHLAGGFLSLVLGWILSPLRAVGHWWDSYSGSEIQSGHGNQHNSGPHQDQIFHIPAAICLALRAKKK